MPNICCCAIEAPTYVLNQIVDSKGLIDFSQLIPLRGVEAESQGATESRLWGARMNSAMYGHRLENGDQSFYFSTAYGPPILVLDELSKANPDCPIFLSWEVSEAEAYHCDKYLNGELVDTGFVEVLRDENTREVFIDAIHSCNKKISPSDIYRRLGHEQLRPAFPDEILIDDVPHFVVVEEYEPDYYMAFTLDGRTRVDIDNPFNYTDKLVDLDEVRKQRLSSSQRLAHLRKVSAIHPIRRWFNDLLSNRNNAA